MGSRVSTSLCLETDEFEIIQRVYTWLKGSGHLDCDALYSVVDGDGEIAGLQCECGDRLEVPDGLLSGEQS